ncbi:MAG: shikimate kinase, partial [Acidimicrobiia bacterium]|nr:shikimate kinase [Acidimicrobiia bacterium]
MGVGKSTTAAALAAELGWPVRDSDADIDTLVGVSGGT